MKHCLSLFALLFFSACGIQVDDLGDAWSRGTVDPALMGKWQVALKPDEPGIATVTSEGGMLRVDGTEDNGKRETDWLKVLRVGNYRFLMMGPQTTYPLSGPNPGTLVRYAARGGELWLYSLNAPAFNAFLQKSHPARDKFVIHFCDPKKELCIGDTITTARLDEETLRIISEIPDDGDYWETGGPFSRISH